MHRSESLDIGTRFASLRPYVVLLRPANILTAIADIIAGFAVATAVTSSLDVALAIPLSNLFWLILATSCLYAGGVVFNDVFDINIDAIERPHRPLPSGRASLPVAMGLGCTLLVAGIVAAWQVSALSAFIAFFIAACALIYNAYGKHFAFFGPLNMSLCRGANLLLGISAANALSQVWYLALIPIIHIAAVTLISRGEVYGSQRTPVDISLILVSVVTLALLSLGALPIYQLAYALPFIVLYIAWFVPALLRARRNPASAHIQFAVKRGVLALIWIDASLVAAFSGIFYGMLVMLLLPISIKLARTYAIT